MLTAGLVQLQPTLHGSLMTLRRIPHQDRASVTLHFQGSPGKKIETLKDEPNFLETECGVLAPFDISHVFRRRGYRFLLSGRSKQPRIFIMVTNPDAPLSRRIRPLDLADPANNMYLDVSPSCTSYEYAQLDHRAELQQLRRWRRLWPLSWLWCRARQHYLYVLRSVVGSLSSWAAAAAGCSWSVTET